MPSSVVGSRTGSWCPVGASAPLPCSNGSTSAMGSDTCEACYPGYFCSADNAHQANRCHNGQYSPGGLTACLPCPAGRYSNINAALATNSSCSGPCQAGFHCPASSFSPTTELCSAGTVCIQRQYRSSARLRTLSSLQPLAACCNHYRPCCRRVLKSPIALGLQS
jgi:hypothetical protein